jgi:hypothetical protein
MRPVLYDLREITDGIKQWCDEVYPNRTKEHMLAKLQEEFKELEANPLDAFEMADIAIILFDLCDHMGFDLPKLIKHKMDINDKRTWSVNDQGILKHDSPT